MKLKRKCCKCKYNVRWFNSKQAFLVLVWVVFYVGAVSSFVRTGQHSFYFLKWLNGMIIPYFFIKMVLAYGYSLIYFTFLVSERRVAFPFLCVDKKRKLDIQTGANELNATEAGVSVEPQMKKRKKKDNGRRRNLNKQWKREIISIYLFSSEKMKEEEERKVLRTFKQNLLMKLLHLLLPSLF